MKRHSTPNYILLSLIAVFTFCLSSCRVNNGDIGILFGSWVIDEMTIDGERNSEIDSFDTFFSFQNNIIQVTQTFDHGTNYKRYGTWAEADDESYINLDFTHHDDSNPQGSNIYKAPEWLGFTSDEIIHLKYLKKTGAKIILEWNNPKNGGIYKYHLRKTH